MMLRRLLPFLLEHRALALGLLALTLADSLWAPVFPMVAAHVQDQVIPQRDRTGLMLALMAVAGVLLARDLLAMLRVRVAAALGGRITMRVRRELFDHLLRLPVSWHDRHHSGQTLSRLVDDVPAIERVLCEGLETAARLAFQIVVVATTLACMDWRLTLVAVIPVPILAFLGWWSSAPSRRAYVAARDAHAAMNTRVGDSLGGIRQIKVLHALTEELERFGVAAEGIRSANVRVAVFWSWYSPLLGQVMGLGYVLVLGVGAWRCIDGGMGVGTLSAFLLLLWAFYDPIQRFKDLHQMRLTALASADRVREILDVPPESQLEDGPTLPAISGHVVLENVHFSHGPAQVLRGLSLRVEPGETVALVGASGAGKTTVLALLARFHDPSAGRILIDGHDLTTLPRGLWRHQLGYVSQEPFLFSGTVRENLCIGQPAATDADLWRALADAGADAFVRAMPEGLGTTVGERGVRLSGGQRQRLALARVMLRNPVLLLLDEATAALDNTTERQIQESLERVMHGRTCIVVAHRLTTVQKADRIVVIDHGRAVESGTHVALLAQDGAYARLWHAEAKES